MKERISLACGLFIIASWIWPDLCVLLGGFLGWGALFWCLFQQPSPIYRYGLIPAWIANATACLTNQGSMPVLMNFTHHPLDARHQLVTGATRMVGLCDIYPLGWHGKVVALYSLGDMFFVCAVVAGAVWRITIRLRRTVA